MNKGAVYIWMLTVGLLWWGCSSDSTEIAGLKLRLIACNHQMPTSTHKIIHSARGEGGLQAEAELIYGDSAQSTFKVGLYEYGTDIEAYGMFLRHGLPQDGMPRVIGDMQETWFYKSNWLISFKSNRFRPLTRQSQEEFLQKFTRSINLLPEVHTMLPLLNRRSQGSALSEGNLLGYSIETPFLTQHYRDSIGPWFAGVSVQTLEVKEANSWLQQMDSTAILTAGDSVKLQNLHYHIFAGLAKNRLVVVWGMREVEFLAEQWQKTAELVKSKKR